MDKKIKHFRNASGITTGIGILLFILFIIAGIVRPDLISGDIAAGGAVVSLFGSVIAAALLERKANLLSPLVSVQATVTGKKRDIGHTDCYWVTLVTEDKSEQRYNIKSLYDAVDIGTSGMLTYRGSAFISFENESIHIP